jgi:exodeoxyribonuclease VII small subunit
LEKKKTAKKKPDFESSLMELEKIAEKLESGELGLEDSIAEFEKGIKYAKFCHQKLEEAENKISILQKGRNGEVKEKKVRFDPETGEVKDDDLQGSLL